jgi:hypothetical protein
MLIPSFNRVRQIVYQRTTYHPIKLQPIIISYQKFDYKLWPFDKLFIQKFQTRLVLIAK